MNDGIKSQLRNILLKPSSLIGIAVSLGLIIAMVWLMPVDQVWSVMRDIHPAILIAASLLTVLNVFIRGFRWSVFFTDYPTVTGLSSFGPVATGMAVNAVLPARLGDLARVALAVRKFGTGFIYSTMTLVGDRLFDALTLLSLLAISLQLLSDAGAVSNETSLVHFETLIRSLGTAAFVLLIAFTLLLQKKPRDAFLRCWKKVPWIGPSTYSKIESVLRNSADGIRTLKDPGKVLKMAVISLMIWLPVIAGNYLLSLGVNGVELSFAQAAAYSALSVAATTIPAAPGAWGVYEAASILILKMIGVDADEGLLLGYALLSHICQYIPIVLTGALAALKEARSNPGSPILG